MIHRDIKPSNIIVDQAGAPHLTDFGIAKLVDEEGLTLTGDLAGTVHYMSPEQAASRKRPGRPSHGHLLPGRGAL